MMPTKPISPLTATAAAVPRVAAATTTNRSRRVSTPRLAASTSPTRSTSSPRRQASSTAALTAAYGATTATSDQDASVSRPRIHAYTSWIVATCRWIRYVCSAVSSAATATPASTIDVAAPATPGAALPRAALVPSR